MDEKKVIYFLAAEFLEQRLGIEATKENVRRFAEHIIAFEKEINQGKVLSQKSKLSCSSDSKFGWKLLNAIDVVPS